MPCGAGSSTLIMGLYFSQIQIVLKIEYFFESQVFVQHKDNIIYFKNVFWLVLSNQEELGAHFEICFPCV